MVLCEWRNPIIILPDVTYSVQYSFHARMTLCVCLCFSSLVGLYCKSAQEFFALNRQAHYNTEVTYMCIGAIDNEREQKLVRSRVLGTDQIVIMCVSVCLDSSRN